MLTLLWRAYVPVKLDLKYKLLANFMQIHYEQHKKKQALDWPNISQVSCSMSCKNANLKEGAGNSVILITTIINSSASLSEADKLFMIYGHCYLSCEFL